MILRSAIAQNHIADNAQCPKFKTAKTEHTLILRGCKRLNIQTVQDAYNGGLLKIEQIYKPKNQRKYKHEDEDAWLKDHPGERFKPFDPKRKIPYKSEKE